MNARKNTPVWVRAYVRYATAMRNCSEVPDCIKEEIFKAQEEARAQARVEEAILAQTPGPEQDEETTHDMHLLFVDLPSIQWRVERRLLRPILDRWYNVTYYDCDGNPKSPLKGLIRPF